MGIMFDDKIMVFSECRVRYKIGCPYIIYIYIYVYIYIYIYIYFFFFFL